jgi:formyltetrahydrofolate deformylase
LIRNRSQNETLIEVTVIGKDKKGVVAAITSAIFSRGGNIQQISQNVVRGLFGMQLEASFNKIDKKALDETLLQLSKKLNMEIKTHYQESNRSKNIAILVSSEEHCLSKILDARRNKEICANLSVIIGSDYKFKQMARNAGVPYRVVDNSKSQEDTEARILKLIEEFNIDLIVLARYMRVLSPNFVWRYPNRIINIHPSLLPAFPGAFAYVQAFEKGAKIVGCTAHFITDELDQGPIICQDAFDVLPSDTLETIKSKGRELEAKTLIKAITLYLEGKLEVNWRRVEIKD